LNRAGAGPIWHPDGSGFYYVRFDIPTDEVERRAPPTGPRIFFHEVGTPQASDSLVFREPSRPETSVALTPTADGEYELLHLRDGASQDVEIRIRRTGSHTGFKPLVAGPFMFLGSRGDQLFFYTTLEASNGRIVAVDAGAPGQLEEIVPEMPEAVAGNSLVGGNAIGYFGGRFVVLYTRDAQPLVRVFDEEGEFLYTVDLPAVGTIWGGFRGRAEDPVVFYSFLSLSDANVVYRLDLETGESTEFRCSTTAQTVRVYRCSSSTVGASTSTGPILCTCMRTAPTPGRHSCGINHT